MFPRERVNRHKESLSHPTFSPWLLRSALLSHFTGEEIEAQVNLPLSPVQLRTVMRKMSPAQEAEMQQTLLEDGP